jgi:tetratricopeptide (TPR) repeat protein
LPAVQPPLPPGIEDPDVQQAIDRARQEVLARPRSAAAWGHLGMTLEAHMYEPEAARCFAEAARLDPGDPRWPYLRGMYALKYEPNDALPWLRQAAAAAASSPDYQGPMRLRLAEALLERRQLDEAAALFREEWERRPGNPRAAFGLGLLALERGENQAAWEFLLVARLAPAAARPATAELAALARARGDDAGAAGYEKDLRGLPNESPAWPDPLVEQVVRLQVGRRSRADDAAQLERESRFREAADLYLAELEKRPTAQACIGAGMNLARLGEYDRAVEVLREGVRLDPDSAQARYTLGLILFSRAEKEWQRSPNSARAAAWFREGIDHLRRATDLKPDHARAYLHWGLSLKYLGEPAAAVEPLRRGVSCRPEDFDLQLVLGEALLEAGRLQEAEVHLENARKLKPKDSRLDQALETLRRKKSPP